MKRLLTWFLVVTLSLIFLAACGTLYEADAKVALPSEVSVLTDPLAAPVEPESELVTAEEKFFGVMLDLLQQLTVIITNAGIPVLLANLFKYVFKKMDGKTNIIVNILTVLLFVAGMVLHFYDPGLLGKLLPLATEQAQQIGQVVTTILTLIGALGFTPVIYSAVKNRVPLLGKSYSAPKK